MVAATRCCTVMVPTNLPVMSAAFAIGFAGMTRHVLGRETRITSEIAGADFISDAVVVVPRVALPPKRLDLLAV